jgi:hypothetical protein
VSDMRVYEALLVVPYLAARHGWMGPLEQLSSVLSYPTAL